MNLKVVGRIERVFTEVSLVFASAESLEKFESLRADTAINSALEAVFSKYGLQVLGSSARSRPFTSAKQGLPSGVTSVAIAMITFGVTFGVAIITFVIALVYYKCFYHRASQATAGPHEHVAIPTKPLDSEKAATQHQVDHVKDNHESTHRRLHFVCLIFLLVLEIACAACYFLAVRDGSFSTYIEIAKASTNVIFTCSFHWAYPVSARP